MRAGDKKSANYQSNCAVCAMAATEITARQRARIRLKQQSRAKDDSRTMATNSKQKRIRKNAATQTSERQITRATTANRTTTRIAKPTKSNNNNNDEKTKKNNNNKDKD